ncbi:hypothetical protein CKO31_03025 [Thiohalocapsa halophila]|uniref:Uncharacterized protein n=1 Tax=Thiohalocapsa halophila TaxID=69359 RepID=A0ABS1CDB9_9GAMM|nr:hypothetical protein [Thiohalocapsa halophila]MBK1629728.1 hypothetical protein [Thiohalocapsa halophila]
MNKTDVPAGFVVCIDNTDYQASLERHKLYKVLEDEDAAADGDLRIVDESGEDYLYSAARFVAIDVPSEVRKSLETAL